MDPSKTFDFVPMFILFSILLCNIAIAKSQSNEIVKKDTLQLVQVIIRHGDRSPIESYPTDIYKNQTVYWPEGWAQLTKLGIQQQLELGTYLRQRYDGFLPPKYSRHDIMVQSSNSDRAIQSAEANLRGLYPLPKETLSPGIETDWHPVPIHTLPSEIDIWINNEVVCPRYTALFEEIYSGPEMTKLNEDNAEFMRFIMEKSGIVGISTVRQLNHIQDSLHSEKSHNLTLPDWATDEVIQKLDRFKALGFVWKVQTKEMKRLQAGPMIGRLMENFLNKANFPSNLYREDAPFQDESPLRKMCFFSGHDFTLGNVMGTWGIFDPILPPYASALMMELHQEPKSTEPYVEIYYRNDTDREPYHLVIPGCGTPCKLSKLQLISNEYIPTDWDQECISNITPAAGWLGLGAPEVAPGMNEDAGISMPGLLALAAGVVALGGLIGSALFTAQRIGTGRSRFVQPPFGVNNYETLA